MSGTFSRLHWRAHGGLAHKVWWTKSYHVLHCDTLIIHLSRQQHPPTQNLWFEACRAFSLLSLLAQPTGLAVHETVTAGVHQASTRSWWPFCPLLHCAGCAAPPQARISNHQLCVCDSIHGLSRATSVRHY